MEKATRICFLQARILFAENRHQESLKQLERSFALHRQDARVYLLAGMNWVILERLDLARPFFEEAVRLAPGDGMMQYHLGRYYYSAQRFAQAEQAFRAAVKLNPDSVKGYDNLALALEAQRKTDEAEASYRKAIELAGLQKLDDGMALAESREVADRKRPTRGKFGVARVGAAHESTVG